MGITPQSISGDRNTDGVTPAGMTTMRSVGSIAIALAVSMVTQNVMFGATGAPGYGDSTAKVFAWHTQNRLVVAIAVAQEALHMLLLLGFLTGLHRLVGRRRGAGADWSRLAVAAGAALSAIFAINSVCWIATVLSVGGLFEPSPTFELAWQLHAAAFALALPALGVTFLGAAQASHKSGLTPPWQRVLGIAGGGLLLAAGLVSLDIADGSPLLFVGLPGLAAWIVWLLVTGARLMRGGTAGRSGSASAHVWSAGSFRGRPME